MRSRPRRPPHLLFEIFKIKLSFYVRVVQISFSIWNKIFDVRVEILLTCEKHLYMNQSLFGSRLLYLKCLFQARTVVYWVWLFCLCSYDISIRISNSSDNFFGCCCFFLNSFFFIRVFLDSGQSFTNGSNFHDIFPGNNKMLSYKTAFKNFYRNQFCLFFLK